MAEVDRRPVDFGLTVAMSVVLIRGDLEAAARTAAELGFEGLEVHLDHLGPGMPGVPVFERHAAAAGDLVRRLGLTVSTLNAVADASFDPYGGPEAFETTARSLAQQLRLAAAMGAPRLLIHEGRLADAARVDAAAATLTRCIDLARRTSGLADPPPISVECHPFTWALAHGRLDDLARALAPVGAGICLDFCHFGVALGPRFLDSIDDMVLEAIDHVHFSDTDATTSELHFPPGEGVLDLGAIGRRIGGRPVAVSWDLFGWPGPRDAIGRHLPTYRAFVAAHAAGRAG